MPTPFCEHHYWWGFDFDFDFDFNREQQQPHSDWVVHPEWFNFFSSFVYTGGACLCFRWYRKYLNIYLMLMILLCLILGIGSALYHLNFQSKTLDLVCKCLDEFAMIWILTMAFIGFTGSNAAQMARSLAWCFGMMAIDFAAVHDDRLNGWFEAGFGCGIVALFVVVLRTTPSAHRDSSWKAMYGTSIAAGVLAAGFWIPIETTCRHWSVVPLWAALAHSCWHLSTAYLMWNVLLFIMLKHMSGRLRRHGWVWFTWENDSLPRVLHAVF